MKHGPIVLATRKFVREFQIQKLHDESALMASKRRSISLGCRLLKGGAGAHFEDESGLALRAPATGARESLDTTNPYVLKASHLSLDD